MITFRHRPVTGTLDENGHLRYQVNGQDILIRGAGWTSEMMLRYSAERFEQELAYVKDMGLNTVRLEGKLEWTPEMISNTIQQDDLYVEMTFAQVMDSVGLDATTEQYGDMFRDSEYHLWHANAGARRNLNRGIKAPMSGHPKYNMHANDIDFQIAADYIGFIEEFAERIWNVHVKDVWWSDRHTEIGVFGGHADFGERGRFWDFRSLGHGKIDFEGVLIKNESGLQIITSYEYSCFVQW